MSADEMDEKVEYEGVPVRIGNRQWIMPSLSVGQAEKYWPALLDLDKHAVTTEEMKSLLPKKFDQMVVVIHAALSRNYKDLTITQIKEMVSIGQLRKLMLVVMGQSGFEQGEIKPAEQKAAVVH